MVTNRARPGGVFPTRTWRYTQTSTNNYATIGANMNIKDITKLTISLRETNVNALLYSVDVSMDGTNFKNLKTDQPLAKNGHVYETMSDPWIWLKVQIKAAVADTQGTVAMYVHSIRA